MTAKQVILINKRATDHRLATYKNLETSKTLFFRNCSSKNTDNRSTTIKIEFQGFRSNH